MNLFGLRGKTRIDNKSREDAQLKLQKPFDAKLEGYIQKLDKLLRRTKQEIENQKAEIERQEREVESRENTNHKQQTEISRLPARVDSLEADSTELHRLENEVKEELSRGGETEARLWQEFKELDAQPEGILVLERIFDIGKRLNLLRRHKVE